MSTVIAGHTDDAGKVLGVHGGDGTMWWVRVATGAHLYSDWGGIEWAAFETDEDDSRRGASKTTDGSEH
jgi:hypothetical protein